MSGFKPLEIFEYPRVGAETTDDILYWKRLGNTCLHLTEHYCVLAKAGLKDLISGKDIIMPNLTMFPIACKEYGSIDYVDITRQELCKIAVTCSSKVQIYSPVDNKVQSTFSRFKRTAYGGVFRGDGKLLVAGSEDGFLRLFEVQSGKPLRIFKGHKSSVHRCNFTQNSIHVVSFSDDKSVGLWDIPTEKRLLKIQEHTDYIRAGAVSQSSADIFLSGSYDHTVKMYDARSSSAILSVDHGYPVESVLMFPTGGIFLSAGGTYLKVWDRVAGRLLAQITQHHKTITSLCFASDGRRLMSGSLDRHVKIYDVMSYDVVHTLSYPSPVLSISSAPEDKVVVAGMTDGLLSIRHLRPEKNSEDKREKRQKKKAHYQYRLYGTDFKPADGSIIVPELKRKELRKHDKCLKRFESSRALDAVLTNYIQSNQPEVTISVIMELIRRGSIRAAMAGREGPSLLPLLKFVTKYIGDPRFMRVLVDIGLILVEIYGSKLNDSETKNMFEILTKAVSQEVEYMKEMLEVQGIIQGILAVAHSNKLS